MEPVECRRIGGPCDSRYFAVEPVVVWRPFGCVDVQVLGEATLESASPLIAHTCTIGDRRPYNAALIVLDPENALAWAEAHRPAAKTPRSCAGSRPCSLSRVEQIKRHTVVPTEWAVGGDELTPTLKLRHAMYEYDASAEPQGAAVSP